MHSVTAILFDLGLPSFDTLRLIHNDRYSYREQWLTTRSLNVVIVYLGTLVLGQCRFGLRIIIVAMIRTVYFIL